jgi:predicted DNA-binding transcriptional regulator AlpA
LAHSLFNMSKDGSVKNQSRRHGDGTERHLSIAQLAAREGVPVRTIYWWNQIGVGPPRMRIGRSIRYRLADVEEWEADQIVDMAQLR